MPPVDDVLLQAVGLIVSFAATFAIAAIGSRFTFKSLQTWYVALRKPSWTPSGRVIGTVWSVLYVLMALAAWLAWRELGSDAVLPLAVFGVQLTLNAGWSFVFFGRQNLGGGLVEIVALWLAVLATTLLFLPASLLAALLLVPYLAWVVIAGNLNRILWRMNRRGSEAASGLAP